MYRRLILARKIQIYIWGLIAFEAQKDFERYFMAVFFQFGAAFRAIFIGQVIAGIQRGIFKELAVSALRFYAYIVRRQRVHFGYIGESGHQRRTYRSPRAYEVSVVERFFDEFMGDQIKRGETVFDDAVQLVIQALLHRLRQRRSVNGFGVGV
ncbi:MAG: hypothetical protein BWY32_03484 [bacterium ADurb.Bin243]|nr:MAG: hypothetical protein BWY32_03484 [bacterium ADurb.Bin243]